MIIKYREIAAALFALCFLFPSIAYSQTVVTVVSLEVSGQRVEKVEDAVVIGTGVDDTRRTAITLNQTLGKGARIRVPSLTKIKLLSAPGNEITLFPQTRFTVLSSDTGETYAACGQALFDVRRLLQFFNVSCESSFASVRGTRFLWNADTQEIKIDVDEGTVSLSRDVYAKVANRPGELLPTVDQRPLSATTKGAGSASYRFAQKEVVREFGNLQEAKEFYKREAAAALEAKDAARLEKASLAYGKVLLLLGDAEGARQQYEQALSSAKTSSSPKVEAWALNNLGISYQSLGQLQLAQEYYSRSLALRRSLYEPVHVEIAQNLNNLGILYSALGKYCQAFKALEEAQEILRGLEVQDYDANLTAAKTMLTLAALHDETMRPKLALKLVIDARARLEKLPLNTNVMIELANAELGLGIVKFDMGNYAEAANHLRNALKQYENIFGKVEHPALANIYDELGRALAASGDTAQGIDYINQALRSFQRRLGEGDHRALTYPLQHLGEAYEKIKRYDDAERAYKAAGDMRRRLYGPEYPLIAETLLGLGRVERARGRSSEAMAYYQSAAEILRKTYRGAYHPGLVEALQAINPPQRDAYGEIVQTPSSELQALMKIKDQPLNCSASK
jgi:tetratricopeptide (TPR) repeat protein